MKVNGKRTKTNGSQLALVDLACRLTVFEDLSVYFRKILQLHAFKDFFFILIFCPTSVKCKKRRYEYACHSIPCTDNYYDFCSSFQIFSVITLCFVSNIMWIMFMVQSPFKCNHMKKSDKHSLNFS